MGIALIPLCLPEYHDCVDSLTQRVLGQIRREDLLRAGDRIGVAVSGGIDSVALWRLLVALREELGIVLSVVHFNHKLRAADSDADEQFVAGLARKFDLEFICDSDDVAGHARDEGISLEAAARELRYGFFRHLIQGQGKSPLLPNPGRSGAPHDAAAPKIDKIVTGHTLDDQAETVLMRMIRGSGVRGLGGIFPRIPVEDDDGELSGEIVRPLLAFRRRELEEYLKDIGQDWREDATNAESKFTRNRVRKLVVPLLEKEFNPAVAENLAELAEIARGEEDYWENEIAGWMGTAVNWSEPEWAWMGSNSAGLVQIGGLLNVADKNATSVTKDAAEMRERNSAPDPESVDLQTRIQNSPWLVMNASVDRLWFLSEPVAVQRRLVKAIGEQARCPLEFKHVEEVLRFAHETDGSGKELSLPLGWRLERKPHELLFLTPDLRQQVLPEEYEYELTVPGRITVNEIGTTIEARRVPVGQEAGYNPEQLLDAGSVAGPLQVRNWRPGDRYWPAHTKSPKKIKELLQERHIVQPDRKLWPVVASGQEIIWLRGFPVPAKLQARAGEDAVSIVESPLPKPRDDDR
jgi:tRNA(Ile)-lysidine synthase